MPQTDQVQLQAIHLYPLESLELSRIVLAPGGCVALDELPAGFGGLSALQKLDLFGCVALTALPQSFGDLASLLELDLSNCTSLQSLPGSFGEPGLMHHLLIALIYYHASLSDCSFGLTAVLVGQWWEASRCGRLI